MITPSKMCKLSARLKVSLQAGHTSSASYLQRKHSIDASLLISLDQHSRMWEMQLGVTICSHRLWTWSRLDFCGNDLEETFEPVTWGPHSTFRIADGDYTGGVVMVG